MVCINCTQGRILPGVPEGSMTEIGGVATYFHPGSGSEKTKAVVLLTDAFGLDLKNNKLLADMISKRLGYDVWVPDLFNGKPLLGATDLDPIVPDEPGLSISFIGKLRLAALILPRIPNFIANRPGVVDAKTTTFIAKVKEEKGYSKIGAVGYCFGGGIAVRIAAQTPPPVDTVVLCHPSAINLEQVKAIKIPSSFACAEEDGQFPPETREKSEKSFAERQDNKVEYEFKEYKGTVHGFAARPNLALPRVKEGFEGAFEQTVTWFEKTL